MSEGRIATTTVMLALFTGASLLALGFPSKAGFAPLLVGVPGALLCLAQLVIDIRARTASPADGAEAAEDYDGKDSLSPREWFMFLWLGIFTAVIVGLGFHVGGPIAVFLYLRWGEREPWANAILSGLGTLLMMWLIFTELLELSLFDGLLLPILLR